MLALALILPGCATAPPSALASPDRAAAIVNSQLVPSSCQTARGPDGSTQIACELRLVPSRTQRIVSFVGMLNLGYDRSQLDDPAFMAALAGFLTALEISPVESVLAVARNADNPREGSASLNVLAAASCMHDRNLPENRGATGAMLRRPGGTLCTLRLSHLRGGTTTIPIGR
ncbi:MAG: hypothetical protein JWR10_2158 [Rubritepida sp.]|nr:hypothetical protein [Rubritepida sp.]